MNTSESYHNLMVELHEKQEAFGEQIHRDMEYIMHIRSGNSHSGEGVTPEVITKVQEILAQKGTV